MTSKLYLLLTLIVFCSANESSRIFGGHFAKQSQFPHQIAIIYKRQLRCGGSIISSTWILTAAHCVLKNGRIVRNLSILAGTNSLTDGGESRNVIASIPHWNYNNRLNDIALMKLDRPLPFSSSIKPIEIANQEVPSGLPVLIAGWGKSSTYGSATDRLKTNTLRAMSSKGCAYSLGTSYKGIMCLGHSRNNGACFGDSGGSALAFHSGVPKLVGVANFIVKTCGTSNPDAYAKVSFYKNWIESTIWKINNKNHIVILI